MKHFLYHLILGSNLGDRVAQIELAKQLIVEQVGSIEAESSLYETQPWGHAEQPWFINQAIAVNSPLDPSLMMYAVKKIEREAGREPGEKWHARHIDIDVLLSEDRILEEKDLIIPHPLFHLRNFTLVPMMEIAPYEVHPVYNKTIEELFLECRDTGEVYIFKPDEQADPL